MKTFIFALCSLLTILSVSAPASAKDLDKVKVVIPRNSVFVLTYFGGRDGGVFKKYGIDLDIDARPFKGFMAGLPSKECMVTTYAGTAAIARINKGLDWVIIGGGLTVMQRVYVRKDSPFQKITDLRGKKYGAFSTGAGAFKATRAALIEHHGFDVMKDTDFVQAAAPALFKFLERGEVDAMFNISSLTIAAASQPDKFRAIYSANEYWKEKTGYPIVWSGPIVAWRSWVEEDRDRAKRLVQAIHASYKWLRDPANLEAAVEKYGTLAAVTDRTQLETYKKWVKDKRFFLARWDQKVVDAQWEFLEMAERHGIIKAPSKKKHALILE